MELILLVAAGALLDYLRGGHSFLWVRLPSIPASLLLGALVAYAAGVEDWWIAAVAAAFALGEAPGWGSVLGPVMAGRTDYRGFGSKDREPWQVGPLRKHLMLAHLARGLMWGAPLAALDVVMRINLLGVTEHIGDATVWPLAFGIAAAYVFSGLVTGGLTVKFDVPPRWRWRITELQRGALTILFTLAATFSHSQVPRLFQL